MKNGIMRLSRYTSGHPAWLQALGYKVTSSPDGLYTVQCSRFRRNVNLTGPDGGLAVLKRLIKRKELIAFTSILHTASGPVYGLPALRVLGPTASALVMYEEKK